MVRSGHATNFKCPVTCCSTYFRSEKLLNEHHKDKNLLKSRLPFIRSLQNAFIPKKIQEDKEIKSETPASNYRLLSLNEID